MGEWFEQYGITDPYYSDKYRVVVKGDCREILPSVSCVSAVVTDPPYELGFMGKSWDSKGVSFQQVTWSAIRRACLLGAPLLSFGGSRTQHRIACAIEDAGWEIRDCLMWVYGSGFPKSLNISKAIDKAKGVEREVVGISPNSRFNNNQMYANGNGLRGHVTYEGDPITKPATRESTLWNGWGTALKPAYEPIILAMNRLDGTFANNALKYGVAGLNIDGCRVPMAQGDAEMLEAKSSKNPTSNYNNKEYQKYGDFEKNIATRPHQKGRFPANLIHDGSDEVVGLFNLAGVRKSGSGMKCLPRLQRNYGIYGTSTPLVGKFGAGGDTGSAARFFYCSKASRSERDNGLEPRDYEYRGNGFSANISSSKLPHANTHPTVKPLALMEYLCKLVSMPEYNLILDPFCGSGTTLLASANVGVRSIGIELDESSCDIAANRCAADAVERLQRGEY